MPNVTPSQEQSPRHIIHDVYRAASVTNTGKHLTTVNQLTDQLPALQPDVLEAAVELITTNIDPHTDTLVTEEDKGIPIAVGVALKIRRPLAVARWYPYPLDHIHQAEVAISSEYFNGTLYLNGIKPGDTVTIVDDTISTGGTLIALCNAITDLGATIHEAHCLVEKIDKGGRQRVKDETGVDVQTVVKIRAHDEGVEIVE